MFFLSRVNSPCVSARVSALFLVIAFFLICPDASADTALLPDPYSTNGIMSVEAWCNIHTLTNEVITFEDWQEYYYPDLTNLLSSLDYDAFWLSSHIGDLKSDLIDAADLSSSALDSWVNEFFTVNNEAVIDNLDYDQFNHLWDNVMDVIWQSMDSLIDGLDIADSQVSDIQSNLRSVRTSVDSVSFSSQEVLDYVEVGMEPFSGPPGGGCSCPDYRSYLLYLQSQLSGISNRVATIENELYRFLDGFGTVARDFGVNSGHASTVLGEWLATYLGASYAIYNRQYDYLNSISTNILAHILDGWCFPTNTINRPLYVQMSNDDWMQALPSLFQNLEVTVKQGTNFWAVAVTNDLQVTVTNAIENVNNIDVDQTLEDYNSKLDELGDPDELTAEPDDYSTVFEDYKSAAQDLASEWSGLFSDIVSDVDQPPYSIRIFSGYQPDGRIYDSLIIVPTQYWMLESGTLSILRSIRSVFRFLWIILEIAIIAKLFKVNIFLVVQGIFVLFAVAGALGCPGLQKISWGEALANIAKAFHKNINLFFPEPEDA